MQQLAAMFLTSDKPHYPYELPKGWKWTTLSEITSIIGDGLHGTPQYDLTGRYFFINGNNLANRKIIIKENTKRVSDEEYIKYRKVLNESTILVSINGTIGNVGTYNGEKVILGKSVCYFNLLPFIFKDYICNIIESDYFRKYALNSATGSTIKNVPLQAINCFYVPIPPLEEQKRIVKNIEYWLSFVDCIADNKEKLQDSIKQAKSKVLGLAIHGKLVPQDPNDEPACVLLKRINPKAEIITDNGHYQKLPVGWCEVWLGEIFNHNTGKALNTSNTEGIMRKYLTTSNVYWNTFDFTTVKQMYFKNNELDKCSITKGDLLVCEGGDIGRAAIWNYDYNICIQNHLHRLRPKINGLCVSFYYYVFNYLKVNNMIGGKGIGLLGLSSNALHKLHVPFPPLAEQTRIAAKIEELFHQLDMIEESL